MRNDFGGEISSDPPRQLERNSQALNPTLFANPSLAEIRNLDLLDRQGAAGVRQSPGARSQQPRVPTQCHAHIHMGPLNPRIEDTGEHKIIRAMSRPLNPARECGYSRRKARDSAEVVLVWLAQTGETTLVVQPPPAKSADENRREASCMEQDSGADKANVSDPPEQLELTGHFLFRYEDGFHLSRRA